MPFYHPDGLKQIALLLNDLLEVRKPFSQNHLAELSGVAPNTIKKLRSNQVAFLHKPDPDTLLLLAPFLENPLTDQPFTEEEILQVARGQLQIPIPGQAQQSDPDRSPLASYLLQYMREHQQDEATFARAAKLTQETLSEIIEGRSPSWLELLKLGAYLFPDKNPAPLLRLLGIDPSSPIEPGHREPAPNGS
jgi:transcriptional regulator with XRE-family HTH domain